MKENSRAIEDASCILAMPCALGVHRISSYIDRPVIPALDTLFIAVEDKPGYFCEVCASVVSVSLVKPLASVQSLPATKAW
jgi:hypothetical protein